MNASLESPFQVFDSGAEKVPPVVRGDVVNRTHRVVRQRAQAMQDKRRRDRSLMLPMALCSGLLLLTAFAVWSGLGLYQGGDVVQATTLSSPDSNHFLMVMLWFVPVSIVLLAALWVGRSRTHNGDGAR